MSFIGISTNIWKDTAGTGGGGASWVLAPDGEVATLDIDFVNNRAWNSGLTTIESLLSCTRATPDNASYTNVDGTVVYFAANTLRYGDNGLLVEESRSNICLQSQDFGTTWAVFDASISTNLVTAPDGTTTGDLFTVNVVSDYPSVFQGGITVLASATYTFSCMAKAGNTDFFTMESRYNAGDDSAIDAYFQLSGVGSVVAVSAGISANIALLSDGWYRCSIAKTNPGAGTSLLAIISNVSTSTGGASLGNNIYIWGAQVEAGAFPTSYIPTVSVSVTRAADLVSCPTANINGFVDFPGSMYYQGLTYDTGGIHIGASFALNVSNQVYLNGTENRALYVATGAVIVADLSPNTPITPGVVYEIADAWNTNDFSSVFNGGTPSTDASGTPPTGLTKFQMGSSTDESSTARLNGLIKRFTYWNSRLPNASLQLLTS